MRKHNERKIVLLGMMTKMPVAGVVWQTVHYLVGFRRLGYDVHYVEAHARTPSMFMEHENDDGSGKAAAFIDRIMCRFGLEDRWAFHALHEDGRCYGMSLFQLRELYRSAELIINLHGGTEPLPEHSAGGRLVYLGTDPVQLEVELAQGLESTARFLEPHCAFFSFGENYGRPDCALPVTDLFDIRPTRQPVVLNFWDAPAAFPSTTYTTIANWRQDWREIRYQGELYRWSKHHEFLKFLDLPSRSGRSFELALSSYEDSDRRLLESHGWRVREALDLSTDIDAYRDYIVESRGEFTVAKDQNVRLRSGWFSDRSATYLAAGRPVITQDTGFGNVLPTGKGLFAFITVEDVQTALQEIEADYEQHARGARDVAKEFFSYDVVLSRLLGDLGLSVGGHRGEGSATNSPLHRETVPTVVVESGVSPDDTPFPSSFVLEPLERLPLRLADETVKGVLNAPLPHARRAAVVPLGAVGRPGSRSASIIVVTFNGLVFTRLCLESVLANTDGLEYEIIVVDNGSTDGTVEYLRELARTQPHIRSILNQQNRGFPSAANQGLTAAGGDLLVLLNNDTLVPQGWLAQLARHVEPQEVGSVGPVTNRICNEAQIDTLYRTYGEFVQFARARAGAHGGEAFDIRMLAMFCMMMRRDVYERVGLLDEQFVLGTLEDEDYAIRLRNAGYRVLCAEDVFVHHFDKASFSELIPSGKYTRLLEENRRRFEEKWAVTWTPYRHRESQEYLRLVRRIRELVRSSLPPAASVVVVSRGDDELLDLGVRRAWHFPQSNDGVYAGHYPADSTEAVAHLEQLRSQGAEFFLVPRTALWWLEHYEGLTRHLHERYAVVLRQPETCVIFALNHEAQTSAARETSAGGIVAFSSEASAGASATTVRAGVDLPPLEKLTQVRPLVSVVIVFLDAERFLGEAIDSVFAQTYPHWELILVDDGSSDTSADIALASATRHSKKVRYLQHPGCENRGIAASRNLGIRNARGEYVALLDSDDVWMPHKLERQVAILDAHPEASIVYGASEYWSSWTGMPEDAGRDFVPELGLQHDAVVEPPSLVTASYPLGKASTPCPSSFIFRRDLADRVGGFEEQFRGLYEDQAFLAKVFLRERVFVARETWDRYRLNPDGCMSRANQAGTYKTVRRHFLHWFDGYLSRQNGDYQEIRDMVKRQIQDYRAKEDDKPDVGSVDFGSVRRLRPISASWGFDRGLPVDRHYVERFLERNAADVQGHVVEIGDDTYTRRFGGSRVDQVDILNVDEGHPQTTIVGDLASADHIPSDRFDCIILTQTLHLIYDVRSAVATLHRILKPGGVLLATFPGITRISRTEWPGSWFWGFTTHSATRLFEEVFPSANVQVESHGNVLAAASFLYGVAAEELRPDELEYHDPDFEVCIALRAVKPGEVGG